MVQDLYVLMITAAVVIIRFDDYSSCSQYRV